MSPSSRASTKRAAASRSAGFVETLNDQADGGQAAEAPILEEGTDGVRLMTTHKAKGLEFPVVILADITAKLKSDRADRLVDRAKNACYLRLGRWTPIELATAEQAEIARDEAEGVRVAYVAATRARDLLVVPAVGDVEWDGGWLSPLNAAIYPPPDRRRAPEAATGCPAFKKDSVWRRPDNDPATQQTVCPGQYTLNDDVHGASCPKGGDAPYAIVWWDPHSLDLEVEPPPGIRRESLIVKDVPESVLQEGRQEYDKWRARLDATIASGSARPFQCGPRPSGPRRRRQSPRDDRVARALLPLRVAVNPSARPVRRAAAWRRPRRKNRPMPAIEIVEAHRGDRPGGARFGELVHAVLASTPLDAGREAVHALTEVQARMLSAPVEEVATASELVTRVLAHELLARARAAAARGSCRRETPRDVVARRRHPGRGSRRPCIRRKRHVDDHRLQDGSRARGRRRGPLSPSGRALRVGGRAGDGKNGAGDFDQGLEVRG